MPLRAIANASSNARHHLRCDFLGMRADFLAARGEVQALCGRTAGQTHLNTQELEQVAVIPAGILLFAFDATFLGLFALQEIEG